MISSFYQMLQEFCFCLLIAVYALSLKMANRNWKEYKLKQDKLSLIINFYNVHLIGLLLISGLCIFNLNEKKENLVYIFFKTSTFVFTFGYLFSNSI